MTIKAPHRHLLVHGCIAAALLAPGAASAQESPRDGLEDIVVTAQRRAQRLEDVPMAIVAISPDVAEQRGIRNLQDLGQSVAGVQINFQGTFTYPAVRGISSLTTGVGFENNVGVYVDGFYQPDSTAINADFANLDSIQVLKGPQGALYGRNATGGAILISTKAPSDTFTGKFEARYGNFDDKSISGFISGPLSEGIKFSVAGYGRRGDGYYDLLDASGRKIGNAAPQRTTSARVKLEADLGENLTATIGYNYTYFRDDRGAMFNNESNRFALPAKVGRLYDRRTFATNRYSLNTTKLNEGTAKLVLNTGLGDVTSYTSYATRKFQGDFDFDGSLSDISFSFVRAQEKTFQQGLEFNIDSIDNLDLVIGATYYNDTTTPGNPSASFAGNLQSGSIFTEYKTRSFAAFIDGTYHFTDRLSLGFGGRFTNERRETDYVVTAYAGGVPRPGGITTLDPTKDHVAKFNNFSPRGVLTYEVADRSNIYASISRGFRSGFLQPQAIAGSPVALTFEIKPETITAYEIGFKTAQPTFRFDMSAFYYDYRNIQVGLTLPNPAGPNFGPINILSNAPKAEVYGVEAQIGAQPLANFNVDVTAAYLHARYKVFPNVVGTGFNPATGRNVTGQPQDWSGLEMARAPGFTATVALAYDIEDVAGGKVSLSSNAKYTSSYVPNNPSKYGPLDPTRANQQRYRQGQYALFNASINWTDASETYSFGVWANNITNVDYRLSHTGNVFGDYGTWAPPRQYGLRAGVKW